MREPKPTYQKWVPPVPEYKSYKMKQRHKQVAPISKEFWVEVQSEDAKTEEH